MRRRALAALALLALLAVAALLLLRRTGESPPMVDVTMVDHGFVAPDTIPSGWVTFRATNEGEVSHHFYLLGLPDGKSYADYREGFVAPADSIMRGLETGAIDTSTARSLFDRRIPRWTRAANLAKRGGVGVLAPGRSSRTTLRMEPGEYVMYDAIRTPDQEPHALLGMVRGLTVSDSSTRASPPDPDVTVRISGRDLETAGELAPGVRTVRFTSDPEALPPGGEGDAYSVWLARLGGGTQLGELIRWGMTTPAPADYLGGFEYLPVADTVYVTLELDRGAYAWHWGYMGARRRAVPFAVP